VIFNSPNPHPNPHPTPSPSSGRDWTTGPAKFVLVACLGVIAGTGLTWSILRGGSAVQAGTASRVLSGANSASGHIGSVVLGSTGVKAHSNPADLPPARQYEESPLPIAATSVKPVADSTAPPPSARPNASASALLNINTATQAQLELLPGIGPALAARIIEQRGKVRRFSSISDLDEVKGIGPKMIEKIKPLIRFE
jgi:competence protein ComEA